MHPYELLANSKHFFIKSLLLTSMQVVPFPEIHKSIKEKVEARVEP